MFERCYIQRPDEVTRRPCCQNERKIQAEEATKGALHQAFIEAMGYDIFDPIEVVPEFIADLGI